MPGPLVYLRDRRLALILALALLAGFLAYQAPPSSDIFVGWLGDRLFLPASQGLGAIDAATFYGDEITSDARSGRSRWSRQDAQIDLPGLGASGDLTLTLRAQGWPSGVLNQATNQPTVDITANGVIVDQFKPTTSWIDHTFRIPADVQASDLLSLRLHISDTFTSTATIADPQRAKGIRLEYIGVRGSEATAGFTLPAALPLVLLALDGALGLLALLVLTRRPTLAFVLTTLMISGAAIGLALARAWMAALLPWLTLVLALLLIYSRRSALLNLFERLLHRYARGVALNYGLVVMVAAWLAYLAARASFFYQLPGLQTFKASFPDSLLYGLLGMGLLLLIIVRGRTGLPRLSNALVRMFGSRRGARALLTLTLLIWIGYEAYVVAGMPYVGHADYADNAVVARNLLAGRGWVVDYVTQYYRLYSGVTRPQETWPLLQPVWIVPFFALFGPTAWAAKIPNLLFTAALALLIYSAGARLWDRRVGLTAALIILTNYLFFRLVIYTTSDLAFTVFAFGAIYLFYRATNDERRTTNDKRSFVIRHSSLVGSGVLTGLMLLQKPASGGLIALGMGLWYLGQLWRARRSQFAAQNEISNCPIKAVLLSPFSILNLLLWSALALAILSPYLVR
ncbi:MAG: glycosyltransferase family 39 protein, partial [Roseiflexaceae bacterium]